MTVSIVRTVLVLTAALAVAPSRAASFEVDPAASEVVFTLGATAHTVHGTFRVRSGAGTFDPASGAADGRIVIDATSGATGNASRDRKMHEKVLESARFPEIVLIVNKLDHMTVTGTLQLHGTSHPLTVPLRATTEGSKMTVTGTFRVPYVEWGLADPSVFILRVDKYVDVTVTLRATVQQ